MALEPIDNYDQISIGTAEIYARAWQERNDLKAFLFHRNDIECILSEQNAIAVRFYMGIKEENGNKCPDMMVVGVNEDNKDLISRSSKDIGPTKAIKTGVYDFTMPCPRTCDLRSDLYFRTGPGIIGGENCAPRDGDRTPSTKDECNIEGFQITVADARVSTLAWQTTFNLKSVLFKKEDLTKVYEQYGVDDIRVYFGLEDDGTERIILVGVDSEGSDDIKEGEDLYTNSSSLCTKKSVTSCSISSPLYHRT